MKQGLKGIKILELSHYVAGPYVGQMLADMGADVYKVEQSGEGKGDIARKYDPMYKGMSLYFASYNRNKKFITLDIKTDKGKEIFKELVKKSDVVIENFRPGVLKRLGLDYEELKKINPGIIMTSVSGYGQDGPYKDRMALDMAIQAVSGFMDFTGFEDGPPTKGGPILSDFIAALYAAIGTIVALYQKKNTGLGQNIDVSLLDSMFTLLENFPAIYHMSGDIPKRSGNGRPFSAPTGTYLSKDNKWIHISATSESLFERLCHLIGREDLINDPNMSSATTRKKNEHIIEEPIINWVASRTSKEALELLESNGIPNGMVQTVEEVINDPQIKYRNMLVKTEETVIDDLPVIGNPIKMSETPTEYKNSANIQGFDNDLVYKELLNLSEEELNELKEQKII